NADMSGEGRGVFSASMTTAAAGWGGPPAKQTKVRDVTGSSSYEANPFKSCSFVPTLVLNGKEPSMRPFRTTSVGRTWVPLLLASAIALQPWATTPASAATRAEHTDFRNVNRDRSRHGTQRLRLSAAISRFSHRHSRRMAARIGLFDNCLSCLLHKHGWSAVGENVGYASSLRAMNRVFMNSPPHRRNILYRGFTRIGVGVVRSGGMVWVTQIFY